MFYKPRENFALINKFAGYLNISLVFEGFYDGD